MKKILLLSIMFGGICMDAAAMEEGLRRADPKPASGCEMREFNGDYSLETEALETEARLKKELADTKAELDQLKKDLEEEIARLRQANEDAVNAAKAEVEEEKAQLRQENEALTIQLGCANLSRHELQGQLGEALNYNEKLNDLNIAANEEFGQLEKVKEAAEKKVQQLKKENAELKGELSAANTINRSNINTIKGLRTNFNVVNKAKIKAEAAQRTAEDQIAQLTRQKTEAEEAKRTAEEEKNRFAEEKDDLTIQLGNKNKEQVLGIVKELQQEEKQEEVVVEQTKESFGKKIGKFVLNSIKNIASFSWNVIKDVSGSIWYMLANSFNDSNK